MNQSVLYDEFPAIALFWKWVRIFLEQLWLGNDEQLVIKQTTYGSGANEMRCHYKQVWKYQFVNLVYYFEGEHDHSEFCENMKKLDIMCDEWKGQIRVFYMTEFF